ncbi:hybrid sensor histidine kinase/response regulator transcription factor [Flavisolibacter nicotianae]|uniref:hybrid sensor histidine kinase/response regulator transcription factor n=1 Tax=Flavisolibacter nicotianae TaxID=2364882 RepID=UPI0013C42472|nr:hybrid sensor histidine kinase/response regulator transcription factor [Flavisolibacter nicotianae]
MAPVSNLPFFLLCFFKKPLLTFFCIAGWGLLVSAQQTNINFTALTTKDGLSSNTVNAILKDRYGLIWFATEDGLDKFDGTNFTVYRHKPGDPASLQANEILALYEDNSGNLWVGTSGGSLSLYDRTRDAFLNFPANGSANAISNNVIRDVCSDYLGNIWIAHFGGVNILDPVTKKVSQMDIRSGNAGSSLTKPGLCLFEDSQHRMWIGTTEGLFQYNPKTKSLTQFVHSDNDPRSISGNNINAVVEDKAGNIWIGTNGGLSLFKPGANDFIYFGKTTKNGLSLSSNFISSIAVDGDRLWLGTGDGLDILDTRTGGIAKYSFDYRNIHSLTAKSVRSIYIDRQGIYWLGMIGGGVNRYDKNLNLFNYVKSNVFDEKGLSAPVVNAFAGDKNGNVYVGTEGGGLSLFDRKTGLFQPVSLRSERKNAASSLTVLALKMKRNNQLLVGTFSDGLFVFDPGSGSYRQLLQEDKTGDLNSNDIFCIEEDHQGKVWLGTNGGGIKVLNDENKVVMHYTPVPKAATDVLLPINGYIRDIEEDREGNIWIATHGGGIAVLDPVSGKFTIYNSYNSKLPNDKVLSLLEDSRGNMWAGTFGGGLGLFNKRTKQFVTFSEKDGLQNNAVYKILEDQKGLLWLSTNKGISSLDIGTKKINNYNYHNGVQNNNFVHGAGLRMADGELFFGGLEGFNYFNPAYLKKNSNIPSILITDLRVANQSVAPSEDGPIHENIAIAKEIDLDYKQNFALSFVGLNYTSPEQNQYAYKLEGFDKDWNYVGNTTAASYTNLDPGTYVFRVKASNNDGVWNNEGKTIRIIVHPPFWRTTIAYIFYVLFLGGLVLYFRHRSLQKLRRTFALEQERMQAEQERKETERIRELDQLKIKFLTNLSHEFRTPISLILGPVDTLLSQEKKEQSSGQLQMIKRNARRLLNLVNQLLDFRKMEEDELRLQATEGELVAFVKEVSDSFKDLSERKQIDFAFESRIAQLNTLFDHDKVERILFNLLSNAFKFTLEGGHIRLLVDQEKKASDPSQTWVTIKVSDTGIGIPADKKEKIFERFFQSPTAATILNQGTGIGLAITKEFVKMHGGSIEVESELGQGTTFVLHLPFVPLEAPKTGGELQQKTTNPIIETEQVEEPTEELGELVPVSGKTELPLILIVEDNDDFRFYLKDNLRLQYKVFEAANGKEGWQKALAHHPQLIVSDVNMPLMDGIAFSKKIKSDKRTSHIPLILLTALTGEEDQLRGLGTGANDYITKPFNFELLNAKIKNLLVLNSKLKDTYTRQIKVLTPEVNVESEDEKLLAMIMLYLEENLTNPQLSVEELSRHVGMSRSSLYSKLLELTGQTPVEYIRSVKLDKAAVLLEKSDLNIAQVAYSVGFSTPNYFAKSFKAKFNMLPSEYVNKMRKEREQKDA